MVGINDFTKSIEYIFLLDITEIGNTKFLLLGRPRNEGESNFLNKSNYCSSLQTIPQSLAKYTAVFCSFIIVSMYFI